MYEKNYKLINIDVAFIFTLLNSELLHLVVFYSGAEIMFTLFEENFGFSTTP